MLLGSKLEFFFGVVDT